MCIHLHDQCGWAATPRWLSIRVQTDETEDPTEGDANSCHTVGQTDGEGGEKLTQRDFKFILSTASATSSWANIRKGTGSGPLKRKKKIKSIDLKIIICSSSQSGIREYC